MSKILYFTALFASFYTSANVTSERTQDEHQEPSRPPPGLSPPLPGLSLPPPRLVSSHPQEVFASSHASSSSSSDTEKVSASSSTPPSRPPPGLSPPSPRLVSSHPQEGQPIHDHEFPLPPFQPMQQQEGQPIHDHEFPLPPFQPMQQQAVFTSSRASSSSSGNNDRVSARSSTPPPPNYSPRVPPQDLNQDPAYLPRPFEPMQQQEGQPIHDHEYPLPPDFKPMQQQGGPPIHDHEYCHQLAMKAYIQKYESVLLEGFQRRRSEALQVRQSMYLSSAQDFQDAYVASSSQTLPRRQIQRVSRPQITSPGTILPSPEGTFIWELYSRMLSSRNKSVVSPKGFEFERVKGTVLIESWEETQSLRNAKGEFKVSLIHLTIKDEELPVYLDVHVERRTSTGWESVYHEPKLQIDLPCSRILSQSIDIKTDGKMEVDENMNMKITIRQSEND